MIALVKQQGADEETRAQIVSEAEAAIRALSIFPESEAKQILLKLAEQEISRIR
jgi:geranylgeranyl pyrophosphate synthase